MKRADEKPCCVYVLASSDGRRTYVGCTNDFRRRLRQHNGELRGGAKYTARGRAAFVSGGKTASRPWKPVLTVWGFPSRKTALQLEWRLHHPKHRHGGKERYAARCADLADALRMDRWTKSAPATKDLLPDLRIRWNRRFREPPSGLRGLARFRRRRAKNLARPPMCVLQPLFD